MEPSATCSAISLSAGEPLLGTAPTARQWLLVEHPGPWEADPVESLPPALQRRVRTWLDDGDRRLQLIRRPGQRRGPGTIVAIADVIAGTLTGGRVAAVDAAALPPLSDPLDPIVLVCVHGRRDRCCAQHGRAVVDALATAMGDELWETSHLGGHRFAATAVVLPAGRVLGRLRPDTALRVIRRAIAGEPTAYDRGTAGRDARSQVLEVAGSARPGSEVVRPASCDAPPVAVRPWVAAR